MKDQPLRLGAYSDLLKLFCPIRSLHAPRVGATLAYEVDDELPPLLGVCIVRIGFWLLLYHEITTVFIRDRHKFILTVKLQEATNWSKDASYAALALVAICATL